MSTASATPSIVETTVPCVFELAAVITDPGVNVAPPGVYFKN